MQFRILGALEVVDGDRRLELGGHRQRAALAILLLAPNRVITTDRMVEELWGEDAPRQAVGSLQAYISNLRRILEPKRAPRQPPRILRSEGGGYLVAVDVDDVDAASFERRAAAGRTSLREGNAQAARETLAQALELWRGPALADFVDEGFAGTEAARLEELRDAALEDRIAADLDLGEHAVVIAELQRLVARQPLRERLWSHLVLALYRSGRQGDALAAYQRCRRTLDEQLGIEPGAALRQLQSGILQQAPALDWCPPAADDASGLRPGPHSATSALLVYRDGRGQPHAFALEARGTLTVGRDATADIWLSWDERVSRRHAELRFEDDQWTLIDEGISSNGSFVNDERINGRQALRHQDEVRFGDTVMTFRLASHMAAAETFLGG